MLYEMHLRSSPTLSVADAGLQLERWYTEGRESTFNTIRYLQHLASTLAFNTQNAPSLFWTDNVHHSSLLFKGTHIKLDNIARAQANLQDRTIDLYKKLTCNLAIPFDYRGVTEDLSDLTPGYSFLKDPRNRRIFGDPHCLAKAILSSEKAGPTFCYRDESGNPVWKKPALRDWLKNYGEFNLCLLTACEMNTGSPPRCSELATMSFCNLSTGMHRNLFVVDQYLCVMRTYSKQR